MPAYNVEKSKKERTCSPKWIKIGLAVTVFLVSLIVGAFFLAKFFLGTGSVTSENSDKWSAILSRDSEELTQIETKTHRHSDHFNGTFELVSVAKNYGEFLTALEIPAYLIYFIQSSAERMKIEVIGENWNWEVDKEIRQMVFNFELRKPFEVKLGLLATVTRTCDVPEANPNQLICSDFEADRNWTTYHRLDFSPGGFKANLHFVNKNVTTEKYYERVESDSKIVIVNDS